MSYLIISSFSKLLTFILLLIIVVGCSSNPEHPLCESNKPRPEDGWTRYYFSTPKDSDAVLKTLNDEQRHSFQEHTHVWYGRSNEYILYIPPLDSTGCFEEVILVQKMDNVWHVVSDRNCLCVG